MLNFDVVIKKIQGFTLLETLVSISIITFVVLGPLSFFVNSSSYAKYTRENMVATSLAEEGVELVQNYYDSLLVRCLKSPDTGVCVMTDREKGVSPVSEPLTSFHVAWRVFKDRLHAKDGKPSCFENENSSGCSFDFYDMTTSIEDVPVRYRGDAEDCSYLKGVASSTFAFVYLCNEKTTLGTVDTSVAYKRVVTLTHYPSFSSSTIDGVSYDYDDDILVVSRVTYKVSNGRTNSVEVRRFIHPRI